MADQVGLSPFQCGGVIKQFADLDVARMVIRIESGGTFKVHITVNGDDPSSTRADYFLDSGEAILLECHEVAKGSKVKILNITGDPKIFYNHKT